MEVRVVSMAIMGVASGVGRPRCQTIPDACDIPSRHQNTHTHTNTCIVKNYTISTQICNIHVHAQNIMLEIMNLDVMRQK